MIPGSFGLNRVESSGIVGEFASQQNSPVNNLNFPLEIHALRACAGRGQTQCRAEQSCVCWHHAPAAIMHPTHVLCSWTQYMRSIATIRCLFRVRSRRFDLEFGRKRRERMKIRMLVNLVTGGLCRRALRGSIPLATHAYTVCYPYESVKKSVALFKNESATLFLIAVHCVDCMGMPDARC